MVGVVTSAFCNLYLFLLRRRQFDSHRLRRHFRTRYDIDVGLYSYGCFDRWRMPGPLRIGRYCSIAGTVRVVPAGHPLEAISTHPALYDPAFGVVAKDELGRAPLVVGDDVWIGHNVVILPGCKSIGRGAVVGAGAIVTRDVPPYAIVAGNPARKLRDRFPPDLARALDDSRWWTLDPPGLADLARDHPDLVFRPSVERLAAWAKRRGAAAPGEA